jgi:hypothetical protein
MIVTPTKMTRTVQDILDGLAMLLRVTAKYAANSKEEFRYVIPSLGFRVYKGI